MRNKVKQLKGLSKKKKRLILIIFAFVLLVCAACYTVFIAPLLEKEEWVYKEATVERGTLTIGVTESGSLEYTESSVDYDLDLTVSSDSDDDDDDDDDDEETTTKYLEIEEVYVTAGQRIEAGDALLKLDEDSVSSVRTLLTAAQVDAQSDYNDAESEYNLSVLEAETTYQTSIASGNYASSIYEDAKASVTDEITSLQVQLDQCNAKVTSLEETLADAQEDYCEALEDYEKALEELQLYTGNTANELIYQNAYNSALSTYQRAQQALTQAEQAIEDNEAKITSLTNELTAAKAKQTISSLEAEETYQEATIGSDNAEITYNAAIESLKETLAEAEEDKTKADTQLEEFEAFVGDDGILYAAESGIVTNVSYESGDKLRTTGTILTYATEDSMTISVDVTQEDVVDLDVGDSVDINFSAYDGTTYEGTIQSIDTTATSRDSNTISYTVVVLVEGDTTALYGGMTADVTFVTDKLDDVLYVSRQAIVEENGKNYVYTDNALGSKVLTEVETGETNGVYIEIKSGLEEGQTIYLASQVSSTSEVESSSTDESTESTDSSGTTDGSMEMPGGDFEMPDGTDSGSFEMPSGGGDMPSGGGDMPSGGGGGMPSGGGPGGQ